MFKKDGKVMNMKGEEVKVKKERSVKKEEEESEDNGDFKPD